MLRAKLTPGYCNFARRTCLFHQVASSEAMFRFMYNTLCYTTICYCVTSNLGTITGTSTNFPAHDDGTFRPCDVYEPRSRPWFIELTENRGKFKNLCKIVSILRFHN